LGQIGKEARMRRALLRAAVFFLALGLLPSDAAQNANPPPAVRAPGAPASVDLVLVLAVDASGSVDDERFQLQKQGYARAFLNQKVLDAIRAGNEQAIAVSMMQWTGPTLHNVMVPWMVIKDRASAEAMAVAIEAAPRRIFGGGTSLSGAIDYSVLMLNGQPYKTERRVIDISGDGSNNLGRPPEQARDEAVKMGIRINGLPILALEPDLDQYFRQNVIGGTGAFIIPIKNYDAFADAILRKLITEISQDQTPRPKFAAK
jgi:uncharacterized protein DUF1194